MRIPGSRTINKIFGQTNQLGIILMYHRIYDASDDWDPWCTCVTPKHFDQQMQLLKKLTDPVSLADISTSTLKKASKRQPAAITFDDGYADNFTDARPILEKYGLLATFYIVSDAVDSKKEFWWDELERIIVSTPRLPELFDVTITGTRYSWHIRNTLELQEFHKNTPDNDVVLSRSQLYFALWKMMKNLTLADKRNILKSLALWADHRLPDRTAYLPLKSDDLNQLAEHPLFDIGAHTVSHPCLSLLNAAEQEAEIAGSKEFLEKIISKSVTSFSYPHGDYNDSTVNLVQRLGMANACSVNPQLMQKDSDPYLLPRFMVMDWDGAEFERKLSGWLCSA